MKATLGKPLAEQAPSYPGNPVPAQDSLLLTLASPNFSVSKILQGSPSQAQNNGTWFAANCPMAYPFVVTEPGMIVRQLGRMNGTSIAGNFDIGIYDTSWNRIVSTGSTAAAGGSQTPQYVDITDTALKPGQYYLVLCHDTTTASRMSIHNLGVSALLLNLAGVKDSATTAFPLPDPLTNMAGAATAAQLYCVMIATRALV